MVIGTSESKLEESVLEPGIQIDNYKFSGLIKTDTEEV